MTNNSAGQSAIAAVTDNSESSTDTLDFSNLEYTGTYDTQLDFDIQIEVIDSSSSDATYAGLYAYEKNGSISDDWLEGSQYADDIYGDYGNDIIFGNAGDDLLFGGTGDIFSGYSYSDYFGDDYLYGGAGNDGLFGENGDDILFGGSGDDWLEGTSNIYTSDRDELWGGFGFDYFVLGVGQDVFYQGSGYATIKDWTGGIDAIAVGGIAENYSISTGSISGGAAADTEIYYNNDLIAVLEDTTDLYGSDFVFV